MSLWYFMNYTFTNEDDLLFLLFEINCIYAKEFISVEKKYFKIFQNVF